MYLASPCWYVEGTVCEDLLIKVECIIGVPGWAWPEFTTWTRVVKRSVLKSDILSRVCNIRVPKSTHSMLTIVRTNENRCLTIQYIRLVVCCVTRCIPILCKDQKVQHTLRIICAGGGATKLGHSELERWEVYGWRQKGLYWRSYGGVRWCKG